MGRRPPTVTIKTPEVPPQSPVDSASAAAVVRAHTQLFAPAQAKRSTDTAAVMTSAVSDDVFMIDGVECKARVNWKIKVGINLAKVSRFLASMRVDEDREQAVRCHPKFYGAVQASIQLRSDGSGTSHHMNGVLSGSWPPDRAAHTRTLLICVDPRPQVRPLQQPHL